MKRKIGVSAVAILTVIIGGIVLIPLLYTQVQNFVPAREQGKETQQDSRNDIAEENSGAENTEDAENGGAENAKDAENGAAGNAKDEDSSQASASQSQEDTRPLTEEEREVLLAYAEYLGKVCEENPDYSDMMRFDLVYIDADDIPELAVIWDCSHCNGVCICVYDDKKVAEVGWFGSNGNFKFKPYANLIFSTYRGLGAEWSSFYRIEGSESVEQKAFHSRPEYQGVEYVGILYEVDGTRVSEKEYNEAYNEACEKWDLEALDEWGYDDALLIKDIGDLYEGMCRRYSEVSLCSLYE